VHRDVPGARPLTGVVRPVDNPEDVVHELMARVAGAATPRASFVKRPLTLMSKASLPKRHSTSATVTAAESPLVTSSCMLQADSEHSSATRFAFSLVSWSAPSRWLGVVTVRTVELSTTKELGLAREVIVTACSG